jgi:septum formation protein
MLILASASAARRRLLREAGVPFEVLPSRARELRGRGRTLAATVLENALRKSGDAARRHPDRWVLAADTMIAFRGRIYGKPASRKAALDLARRLSGKTHDLATGVVLRRGGRLITRAVISRVKVRRLDDAALRRILASGDPTRVAGGYRVKKGRDPLIERIEGSFSNVIGLPMEWLLPRLETLSVSLGQHDRRGMGKRQARRAGR